MKQVSEEIRASIDLLCDSDYFLVISANKTTPGNYLFRYVTNDFTLVPDMMDIVDEDMNNKLNNMGFSGSVDPDLDAE